MWRVAASHNRRRRSDASRLETRVKRFLTAGTLMNIDRLRDCVRANVGDITFAEAHALTGRSLTISVISTTANEPPRVLNHIVSPDVLLWSAACASCALPLVFGSVQLLAKRGGVVVPHATSDEEFADGSIESDLPMQRVAELFGVTHFLCSQCNPHIVPLLPPEVIVAQVDYIVSFFEFTSDVFPETIFATTLCGGAQISRRHRAAASLVAALVPAAAALDDERLALDQLAKLPRRHQHRARADGRRLRSAAVESVARSLVALHSFERTFDISKAHSGQPKDQLFRLCVFFFRLIFRDFF